MSLTSTSLFLRGSWLFDLAVSLEEGSGGFGFLGVRVLEGKRGE